MNPSQVLRSFHKKEVDWLGNLFGGWHSFYKPEQERSLGPPGRPVGTKKGYKYVVDIGIKGFFDNILHEIIIRLS